MGKTVVRHARDDEVATLGTEGTIIKLYSDRTDTGEDHLILHHTADVLCVNICRSSKPFGPFLMCDSALSKVVISLF